MTRSACLAILAAVALASCVSAPVDPQLEASATYQSGYADGCATGTARSKTFDRSMTRDETAYAEDETYRRGWNSGYRSCGTPATQNDPYSAPVGGWKNPGPLN